MRAKVLLASLVVCALGVSAASDVVLAKDKDNDKNEASARLTGFQEVPAISTRGHGTLKLVIHEDSITYELTYTALSSAATASHIHLGQRGVAGGVSAFLCGGGTTAACPSGTTDHATVTGTIVALDVIGPASQGINAGEFAELVHAIRAGVTYANVHNAVFPAGEIRGQIRRGGKDRD